MSSLSNDPLAGLTAKQVFIEAVWLSDEGANTKLFLLCLARFFDKDCHSASMSYGKIAQDCGFSEITSKRCANDARDRWLRIGVGKGFHVPGKGRQNLYRGIVPIDVLRLLREHKLAQIDRQAGCHTDTPVPISRYPTDTPATERGITVTPRSQSGVSERAPKCESISNQESESKESQNQTTDSAAAVAREKKVAAALPDLKLLEEKILGAVNGALVNPASAPGLLSMSIPLMWIESGADLDRDVLPTLKAVGAREKQRGRQINNWNYFTNPIADAKRIRESGGAVFAAGAGPPNPEVAASNWLKTEAGKMVVRAMGREKAIEHFLNRQKKAQTNAG